MEIPEQSSSPSVKAYDFSDLPLEIIHHILMVGPCESAIALSLVNKRFKSICSTPLVYLEIIEDKLQHDPKWRGKRTIPWHNIAGVHLEDDYRKSVRWALADSRARASSADNNVALSGKPLELLRWEPYLLAVNHPEARAISVRARADTGTWQVVDREEALRYSFVFAYSMLLLDVDSPGRSSNLSRIDSELKQILNVSCARLDPVISLDQNSLLHEALAHHEETWKSHVAAHLALGWFAQQLQHALRVGRIAKVGPGQGKQLSPPGLSRLPFSLFTNSRPPYSPEPFFTPTNSITQASAVRSLLEEGEWIGYYSYHRRGSRAPTFDCMMRGISFKCSTVDSGEIVYMRLDASGTDGCGTFRLQGIWSTNTGYVNLIKEYDHGTAWPWTAVLNGFGLFGSWGHDGWGGCLYCWRRDWSDEQ